MKRIAKLNALAIVLNACLLLAASMAWSEDIDLFVSNPNADSGSRPTILLIWDNAANNNADVDPVCYYTDGNADGSDIGLGNSKAAGMEQCAMVNALLQVKNNPALLGNINIGLMVFNHNGFNKEPFADNGTNNNCGYLYFPPTQMNLEGVSSLIDKVKAFDNSLLSSGTSVGDTFAEAWAALNGKTASCSGRDYSFLVADTLQCRDTAIIYIGNAFKNSNSTDGNNVDVGQELKDEMTANFGYAEDSPEYDLFSEPISVTGVNTSGNDSNKFWADEWTRFMKRVNVDDSEADDRNVTTYTISVTDSSKQAQPTINYYAMVAKQGAGKTFQVDMNDPEGLATAILKIFNEVQSVNSVFAAATLPVSANTQGTFLNQIYIAMFRPDGNAEPRWLGNIKQYRLGFDAGGNLVLTDSQSKNDPVDDNGDQRVVESVTNPITGTVAPDAISFWTTNTPGVSDWPVPSDGNCPDAEGFWKNAPTGAGLACDSPDGDLVEKGGAAQILRAVNLTDTYADSDNENSRRLFTCDDVTCSSLTNFSLANTTLTSSASNPFGITGAQSGVTLQFGEQSQQAASIGCLSGSGTSRNCTLSYDGNPNYIQNDLLFLPDLTSPNCSYTKPCSVISAETIDESSASVEFTDGSNVSESLSVASTTIGKASRLITASSPAHGLVGGEQVLLSGCSVGDSSQTYNLPELPGTDSLLVSVNAVPDADTFIFRLSDTAAFSGGSANISCTVTPELTPEKLVRWVRGEDNNAGLGQESPSGPCPLQADGSREADCPITVRASIHGDVLHSRPAVINYDGDVVVFYGANDGVFRAINGNQTESINGVRPGEELWGFIAPEFFQKFPRLYKNSPLIDHPGILDPATQPLPKDYFFDGSATVLQDVRPSGTSLTNVYMTARRGGRLIYAMDASDKLNPSFLWKLTDADIPELGQTWSQPRVGLTAAYVDAVTGARKPVLFMGAGYDPLEDEDPASGTNIMGRGILILDASTGDPVWSAMPDCTGMAGVCVEVDAMDRSIAADLTLIDFNGDGLVDRLYAADVGGNIWRVDTTSTVISDWAVKQVASLGGTGNDARKFLFAPDVVPIPNQPYDLVIAVSGDREKPLYTSEETDGLAYNVNNRFYLIKDAGSETPIVESDLVDMDQCIKSDGTTGACEEGDTPIAYDLSDPLNKGYYFTFRQGEKGVNAPLSVAGKTFFATNQPDIPNPNACSATLGIARAYEVDFRNGTRVSRIFSGGGLPPSPIAGLVTIGNDTIPFVIGGQGPSPFDPGEPVIDLSNKRNRAYWYFE